MKPKLFFITLFAVILGLYSCEKAPQKAEDSQPEFSSDSLKVENLEYSVQGTQYKAYVTYDSAKTERLPVVYIFPEWWGMNDYVKGRASQIAKLGYMAIVVDMFGNATEVDNPKDAQELTSPIYQNPLSAKEIFEGVMAKAQTLPQADVDKSAAIGYCFGGAMALNMARMGEPLKGVVSFHGNLETGVRAQTNQIPMLVLNGEADENISKDEIAAFKKEMDSAGVNYSFINYPEALHSFTNPEATKVGEKYGMKVAYNENADKESWQEMKSFLNKVLK